VLFHWVIIEIQVSEIQIISNYCRNKKIIKPIKLIQTWLVPRLRISFPSLNEINIKGMAPVNSVKHSFRRVDQRLLIAVSMATPERRVCMLTQLCSDAAISVSISFGSVPGKASILTLQCIF